MAEKLVNHALFVDGSVDPKSLSEDDKQKHIMVIGKVADMYGKSLDRVKIASAKVKIGGTSTDEIGKLAAPLAKALEELPKDLLEITVYVTRQGYAAFNIAQDVKALNKSVLSYYEHYLKDVLANRFATPVELLDEHNRIVVNVGKLFDEMMGSKVGRVVMQAA